MSKKQIDVVNSLVFMVECTLATIEDMCQRKSRPKREFLRQIDIAQHGVTALFDYGVAYDSNFTQVFFDHTYHGRVKDVIGSHKANVTLWSNAKIAQFDEHRARLSVRVGNRT